MSDPSAKGDEGRDDKGRFVPGYKGGPGNPRASHVEAWRKALVEAVTPEDIADVVRILVVAAKAGKKWAIPELLNRTVGKPTEHVALEAAKKFQIVIMRDDAPDASERNGGNGGSHNPETEEAVRQPDES